MKNIKKLPFKILAGIVAAVLTFIILFVTNSFTGNPISANIANKAIKQYVGQKYSSLDLKIAKASYNFKDGGYVAKVESQKSIDTKFAIYYRNGKVQRDDYESYVLGMFNTIQRLSDEYSYLAKNIVSKNLGYDKNTTMVTFDKNEYGNLNKILKLDMKFDKALFINAEVILRLNLTDNSIEGIAKLLTDSHKVFVDNNCNFSKYSLYSENDGMTVMVNQVTSDDIKSGQLIALLEKAKNNKSETGISIFIKGEKK